MEGLALGGSVGGLYGAGGGLVIGLIAGLVTADSHYGASNAQIQIRTAEGPELSKPPSSKSWNAKGHWKAKLHRHRPLPRPVRRIHLQCNR